MANGSLTPAAGEKRIVISIDAMGGDRGPAAVVAGMLHSAVQEPRRGVHRSWRRGGACASDRPAQGPGGALRAAPRAAHRHDERQAQPGDAPRRGHFDVVLHRKRAAGRGYRCRLLREYRRADGAVDDPPAQAARRQPPCNRLPLALAQSGRVQPDAGCRRRYPGGCRGPAAIRDHGRILCPQRPASGTSARRAAERRHGRTQGPGGAEACA